MSCALCHFGFEFCQRQRSCDLALVSCVNNVFFPLLPVGLQLQLNSAQFGFFLLVQALVECVSSTEPFFFFFLIIII